MCLMRVTVTLEPEVIHGIRQIQQRRPDASFDQIVNEILRKGLEAEEKFTLIPLFNDAVPKPGLNFDCIQQLLSQVEGDDRKW